MADSRPVRRVVTGHGADRAAKVLTDAAASNKRISKSGGVSTLIWCTDSTPADIRMGENIEDMGARTLGTPPPPNGTRFTVNDIPPGRTGPMHRTETIDYVIVLAGELEMQMDDSTVKLKAGDVLVQRGTNHAWILPISAIYWLAFRPSATIVSSPFSIAWRMPCSPSLTQ